MKRTTKLLLLSGVLVAGIVTTKTINHHKYEDINNKLIETADDYMNKNAIPFKKSIKIA